jgi:hypothetical protein
MSNTQDLQVLIKKTPELRQFLALSRRQGAIKRTNAWGVPYGKVRIRVNHKFMTSYSWI